jgi:hypothetical protein
MPQRRVAHLLQVARIVLLRGETRQLVVAVLDNVLGMPAMSNPGKRGMRRTCAGKALASWHRHLSATLRICRVVSCELAFRQSHSSLKINLEPLDL